MTIRSARLTFAAAAAMSLMLVTGALAQSPTEAQREALRSNCAGDFQAHCAGVSPGGMDALLCLERNEASLSGGCRSAVDAVKGPSSAPAAAATRSAAAPSSASRASAPATPAAKPAAPAPALPFREEVRIAARACFGDFNRFCPNLPLGHGNMVRCLKEHRGELEPACHAALAEAGGF